MDRQTIYRAMAVSRVLFPSMPRLGWKGTRPVRAAVVVAVTAACGENSLRPSDVIGLYELVAPFSVGGSSYTVFVAGHYLLRADMTAEWSQSSQNCHVAQPTPCSTSPVSTSSGALTWKIHRTDSLEFYNPSSGAAYRVSWRPDTLSIMDVSPHGGSFSKLYVRH
jgi:hypothetical protein